MVTELYDSNKRNSLLEAKNANLRQQVLSKSQPPAAPAEPVENKLTSVPFYVLQAIAMCNVKDIRPTISMLATMTNIDAIEIHVATDILVARGFSRMNHSIEGEVFTLTVDGRAYYLANKERA
jgi:hypothetical protein